MESWLDYKQQKIIPPNDISYKADLMRSRGLSIATLNGSFDLMHAGHLHILYEAAGQGDVLIVALNSDSSIKAYKGADRPIIPLEYRLEMMAALQCVSFVTWFDETDPRNILSKIKPNTHVNGEEYGHDCIEAGIVKECGGRLHLVKRIPGLSTSQIIKKIATLCD